MAKGHALAWKELRVGILVISSIVLLGIAIFFIGGDTGVFTPKYKVTVYFRSANGLHKGAVVLLDGVTIGNVASITLSEQPTPDRSVDVVLQLNKSYHDKIRADTTATIGTVGVLGDQQVELTRGSPNKPALEDGGAIQGADVGDIKKIISSTNDVVANLGELTTKMGTLLDNVNQGKGTVGMLLTDKSLYNRFNSVADKANDLVFDAHYGNGTAGKLINDPELYNSVKSKIDRLDVSINKVESILAKIDRGDGTAGRFINDPSLYNKADKIVTTFGTVADRIERGEGTLGKLSKDDALYTNINTTVNRVDKLLTSVENGEGTIGKLMKDSNLYNSLIQTSSEVQKLMYDFRQNPKKYLTINFRLF
jgi:phospholipid/cholesterol/gamma-HCH transport system substrate-binding protein